MFSHFHNHISPPTTAKAPLKNLFFVLLSLQINSQSLEDAKALGQKSLGPVNSKIGLIFKNETDVMWRVSITDTVQGCYMAVYGGYMTDQGGRKSRGRYEKKNSV